MSQIVQFDHRNGPFPDRKIFAVQKFDKKKPQYECLNTISCHWDSKFNCYKNGILRYRRGINCTNWRAFYFNFISDNRTASVIDGRQAFEFRCDPIPSKSVLETVIHCPWAACDTKKFAGIENSERVNSLSTMANNVQNRNAARKAGESGFTLIELLVVLSILGGLFALVGPRVFGAWSNSNIEAAQIQILSFAQTLEFYRMDNGEFPSTEQGLLALLERPNDAKNWNGPYLNKRVLPNDPWGNDYVYRLTEDGRFELFSLGADNQRGGDGLNADIGGDLGNAAD